MREAGRDGREDVRGGRIDRREIARAWIVSLVHRQSKGGHRRWECQAGRPRPLNVRHGSAGRCWMIWRRYR